MVCTSHAHRFLSQISYIFLTVKSLVHGIVKAEKLIFYRKYILIFQTEMANRFFTIDLVRSYLNDVDATTNKMFLIMQLCLSDRMLQKFLSLNIIIFNESFFSGKSAWNLQKMCIPEKSDYFKILK